MSFVFGSARDDECDEEKKLKTVLATDIVDWVSDTSHVGQPLTVRNALVEGPIDLVFRVVECSISFLDSVLTDRVDFSGATLRHGVRLDGSRFHQSVQF